MEEGCIRIVKEGNWFPVARNDDDVVEDEEEELVVAELASWEATSESWADSTPAAAA